MNLDFVKNNFLFGVGCIVSAFVIAQSFFFIYKAYKQGLKIGLTDEKMKKVMTQSAIFTIVPSLAILLTVVTLSKALGLMLPWIRLSVIGAITYEVPAAEAAAKAFGGGIGTAISDPVVFSTIAWVMTIGSLLPLVLIPLFLKKIQKGVNSILEKDKKWGEIFMSALFLGMISAFLGAGIAGSESGGVVYGSVISILTLLSSAIMMGVLGYLIKVKKIAWLENFALPVCMIFGMAMAILFFNVLPHDISSWRIPGIF